MIPRRVSGFNLPALLPEQGFNVAKALVGTEVHVRARAARRRRSWSTTRPCDRCWCSAIRDIFAAADHVVEAGEVQPDRPRGARRHVHRLHEEEGPASART